MKSKCIVFSGNMSLDSLLNKKYEVLIETSEYETLLELLSAEDKSLLKMYSANVFYASCKHFNKLNELYKDFTTRTHRTIELEQLRLEFFRHLNPNFSFLKQILDRYNDDVTDRYYSFAISLCINKNQIRDLINDNNINELRTTLLRKHGFTSIESTDFNTKYHMFSQFFDTHINCIRESIAGTIASY